MASLYDMTPEAATLYELFQQEEIDEETLSDTLDAMGVTQKIEATCYVIKKLENDSEYLAQRKSQIEAMKKTVDNNINRARKNLGMFLDAVNEKNFTAGTFKVSRVINQTPTYDEEKIPKKYFQRVLKLDKTAIKNAVKNGIKVRGVETIETKGVKIR